MKRDKGKHVTTQY